MARSFYLTSLRILWPCGRLTPACLIIIDASYAHPSFHFVPSIGAQASALPSTPYPLKTNKPIREREFQSSGGYCAFFCVNTVKSIHEKENRVMLLRRALGGSAPSSSLCRRIEKANRPPRGNIHRKVKGLVCLGQCQVNVECL
ncbi:uncharacterized protein LY79DRAFT_200165 [Colletotrichum navitas]|uniref:Uncharacterized protein n=1 Tax=Colletotrichum navitas TaxID=681940 RepID=A0AAD8Q051_9PEZI|nr:uncharacterized protein LY79DRAFT_200165 [Colletotrichum navitas]KAK1590784.1 hypothetical protein LY79DRAFT_200165 [Colletotrichum navitas]